MLKHIFTYCFAIFPLVLISQNIQVDSQTYTVQQLIEDILIGSDCISNVVVTNVLGGDFNNTDQSYGYFDATGTTFPFQEGIVLSTGRLANVPGPNTTLSDDDAPNWAGDEDLENVLNESDTFNATILEFDFTSTASEVSFKYIFASEEYQENSDSTCEYSDLFGFLIKEVGNNPYENIALVPGTTTPVKVTTVHPEIPGECQAENEGYFGGFNGSTSPINFNGQTTVMTATKSVIPNQAYHVKLVIADEQNYRYDSAVFLEAGSFQLSTDLGLDRLIGNGNALCENDTLELDATQAGMNNSYRWYKNGVLLGAEQSEIYTVMDAGEYSVEVTLDNNCIVYGDIRVEYSQNPIVFDSTLVECDFDQDGYTVYDLFDAQNDITNIDNDLTITHFYTDVNDAENEIAVNAIPNPESFENTQLSQIVYASVLSSTSNCSSVAALQLEISSNTITIPPFNTCDDDEVDGFTFFDFDEITATFQSQLPADAIVTYHLSEQDAIDDVVLTSPYKNSIFNSETLYVKVESNNQCFTISTVDINILETPILLDDESIFYCQNKYPSTIPIDSGLISNSSSNFTYQWYFNDALTSHASSEYQINETGEYRVVVTAQSGCSSQRIIRVNPSSTATIDDIIFTEGTYNNAVTVVVSGNGVYEYMIDNEFGQYQESNTFESILPGFHEVFVRDKNGCGIVSKKIAILGFPKYFTPNEDGIHDTWQVLGVNSQLNNNIQLQIYDRFGKILAQFKSTNLGWDGTYNNKKLPSADYWFVATLPDGKIYRGHFTLKR